MIVMVTFAVEAVQGALPMVQRSTIGPIPVRCVKVALGTELFGLKVPVPPLTTDHAPVPTLAVLPPRPAVVLSAQIVCALPTVAFVGGWLIVIVTSAVEGVHGALLMVQRTTTGPVPPVCVKVAFGVFALEKVPVPPLITDHAPVPVVGVFPPRPAVVPIAQIVCAPPTVAVVGG